MRRAVRRGSGSAVPCRHPDWLGPTSDGGEELVIQRLDDLVDWSGWLALCCAEREPAFGDVGWRSLGD
jgi:hypothetical protein